MDGEKLFDLLYTHFLFSCMGGLSEVPLLTL